MRAWPSCLALASLLLPHDASSVKPEQAQVAGTHRAGFHLSQTNTPTIGVAWLENDGTIVLRLVASGEGGKKAEGLLRYPRSHPDYQKILEHVGPLQPGEVRPVRPWPD